MIKTIAIGASLLFTLVAASAANAEGGCGIGYHRGPYGGCRPNAAVVVAPGVVIGPRAVVVAPAPRACPWGYHLGPYGHRCWPN